MKRILIVLVFFIPCIFLKLEYSIWMGILVLLSLVPPEKLILTFSFAGIVSFSYFSIFWREKFLVSVLLGVAAMIIVIILRLIISAIFQAIKKET